MGRGWAGAGGAGDLGDSERVGRGHQKQLSGGESVQELGSGPSSSQAMGGSWYRVLVGARSSLTQTWVYVLLHRPGKPLPSLCLSFLYLVGM